MIVIGLTGGMGSGKSSVSRLFLKYGINSIDTDLVSRNVCKPGMPCLVELTNVFGDRILNTDCSLNRKKLASIVFSDKEKLKLLNSVTHKYILTSVRQWLDCEKQSGRAAAIVDAPLLYESGFDKECDIVISVISDKTTRIKRVMDRDNSSFEDAKKRFDNQLTDNFYTKNANYVITNNGSLHDLEIQIDRIYTSIFGERYS